MSRKKFGAFWKKAKDRKSDFAELIDSSLAEGKYNAQLVFADLVDTKNGMQALLKAAVIDPEGEDHGKLIGAFQRVEDEESFVYLQRALRAFSVNVDDLEVETEEELKEVLHEAVSERPVASVTIKEKDGYTNAYFNKPVGVDEDDLHDPADVLKQGGGSKENDDAEELEAGDRVTAPYDDERFAGVILSVNEDGEAEVQFDDGDVDTFSADDLEPEEAKDDDAEEEADDDSDDDDELPADNDGEEDGEGLAVDDRVSWTDENGDTYEGTVTSMPPNSDEVQVTFDDEEVLMIDAADLEKLESDDDSGEDEGGDEEGDEDEEAPEKGDAVEVTIRGKDRAGVVQTVNNTKKTCRVKLEHNDKVEEFKWDEVFFVED